jgi:hypothetical protein
MGEIQKQPFQLSFNASLRQSPSRLNRMENGSSCRLTPTRMRKSGCQMARWRLRATVRLRTSRWGVYCCGPG